MSSVDNLQLYVGRWQLFAPPSFLNRNAAVQIHQITIVITNIIIIVIL